MDILVVGTMALALAVATILGHFSANRGFPLATGRRIGDLDGLRGYLAIIVIFHHFLIWQSYKAGLPWETPPIFFYTQLGKVGVGLFFMITGCVFYPRVLSGLTGNNWVGIYISRVFRIVPMVFATTMAVTIIIIAETNVRPDSHFPVKFLWWMAGKQVTLLGHNQSFIINAGVLWSIYYEWIFYFMLLPLCATLRGIVGGRTWIVPATVLAISLALRVTGHEIFQYTPLFAAGMLAYEASTRPSVATVLRSTPATIVALVCLALVMIFFPNASEPVPMALLWLFFVCVTCGNSIFGLLKSRGALVLGEASFSIYVMHGIILYLAFHYFPIERYSTIALIGVTIVVTTLSMLTFLVIERPFIALGRRVSKVVAPRVTAAGQRKSYKPLMGPPGSA